MCAVLYVVRHRVLTCAFVYLSLSLFFLALCSFRTKRYLDESVKAYEQAVEVDPVNPTFLSGLASVLVMREPSAPPTRALVLYAKATKVRERERER